MTLYVGLFSGDQEMSAPDYQRRAVTMALEGGVLRNRNALTWGPLASNWGICDRVGLFETNQGGTPVAVSRTVHPVDMQAGFTYRIPKSAIRFAGAVLDTALADQFMPDQLEGYLTDVAFGVLDLPSIPGGGMRIGEGYRRTV